MLKVQERGLLSCLRLLYRKYVTIYIYTYTYVVIIQHQHVAETKRQQGPCSLQKVFSIERVTSITEKIRQNSESCIWAP